MWNMFFIVIYEENIWHWSIIFIQESQLYSLRGQRAALGPALWIDPLLSFQSFCDASKTQIPTY